jgi:uncharacterized membrane protein YhaH (DUF805 family)
MIDLCIRLALAFLIKLSCVALLAKILNRRLHDRLEAVLVAWIVVEIFLITFLLLLSLANLLTGRFLWVLILILAFSLGIYGFLNSQQQKNKSEASSFMPPNAAVKIAILVLR